MGYDVHITRASDWLDGEDFPVPLAEWLGYIRRDPEMELEDVAVAHVDGEPALAYQNEGLAVWVAYSGHGVNGNRAWFDYRGGCVVVKNPDDEILAKMKAIASALSARVVGDDGEEY